MEGKIKVAPYRARTRSNMEIGSRPNEAQLIAYKGRERSIIGWREPQCDAGNLRTR